MAVLYRHTQRGTAVVVVAAVTMLVILVAFVWSAMRGPSVQWPLLLIGIVILASVGIMAWYFSSMTVEVTDDEVRWHFGPGRPWRLARGEIGAVRIAPHSWLGGYGIRWFGPRKWVYIVSGRDTVELSLKGGGWRRLGTDDPHGLLRALTAAPVS